MHRPGLFPWEDDAIAGAPEQLVSGDHSVERAARPFGGVPQLASGPGSGIRETNRPRLGSSNRSEEHSAHSGRNANESDLLSIRRPDGIGIAVNARVEILQRFRVEVVD